MRAVFAGEQDADIELPCPDGKPLQDRQQLCHDPLTPETAESRAQCGQAYIQHRAVMKVAGDARMLADIFQCVFIDGKGIEGLMSRQSGVDLRIICICQPIFFCRGGQSQSLSQRRAQNESASYGTNSFFQTAANHGSRCLKG